MAVADGAREIPDSEEEPLTSSPDVVSYDAIAKPGETARGPPQEPRDASQDEACKHQESGALVSQSSSQCPGSLGVDQQKASMDVEPSGIVEQADQQPNLLLAQNNNSNDTPPLEVMADNQPSPSSGTVTSAVFNDKIESSITVAPQSMELDDAQKMNNEREQGTFPATQHGKSDVADGDGRETMKESLEKLQPTVAKANASALTLAQSAEPMEIDNAPNVNGQDRTIATSPRDDSALPDEGGPRVSLPRDEEGSTASSLTQKPGASSQESEMGDAPPKPLVQEQSLRESLPEDLQHQKGHIDNATGVPRMEADEPPAVLQPQSVQKGEFPVSAHVRMPKPSMDWNSEAEHGTTEVQGVAAPTQQPTNGTAYPRSDMDVENIDPTEKPDSTSHPASLPKLLVSQQQPAPPKNPQETTLAELRAQKAALLASLAELPSIQDLVAEDDSSETACQDPYAEPTNAEVMAAAHKIVKKHIKLLHEYNEIKDVGQGLMGLIADQRGVRIIEVQDEFGVDAKD